MCLYVNLKETKRLKKEWKDNRKTVKVIKKFALSYVLSYQSQSKNKLSYRISSPFRGNIIKLDKNGYFVSDRLSEKLSPTETKTVDYGIHCYYDKYFCKQTKQNYNYIENLLKSTDTNEKYGLPASIYLEVEARKKDLVAIGDPSLNGIVEIVFTKIKFPKEIIKKLKKLNIDIEMQK